MGKPIAEDGYTNFWPVIKISLTLIKLMIWHLYSPI